MLSIITPFFNEGHNVIERYFSTMVPILNNLDIEWQIVCIDDGSTDDTMAELTKKAKQYKSIVIISFARNFGKESAITAGLRRADGDAVIPIDADLQDPPTLIPKMLESWRSGYEVVIAQRTKRDDSFFKSKISDLYHYIISKLTHGHIPPRVGDFRLMDKKVVNVINSLDEKSRYMKGIFAWVGFKQKIIQYHRPNRSYGTSKQSFSKLWKLALDGIFAFSTLPLKIWVYIGLIVSVTAFVYAIFIIAKALILGIDLPGYTSLMVAILFMGGINLFSLGIIGEYVARIYKEVKNRPNYVIKDEMPKKKKSK